MKDVRRSPLFLKTTGRNAEIWKEESPFCGERPVPDMAKRTSKPSRESWRVVEGSPRRPSINSGRRPERVDGRRTAAGKSRELARRLRRVREALCTLGSDLRYFAEGTCEERDRLRGALDWPEVGRVTSLVRALAEESRFQEWSKFNRASSTLSPAGARAGRKRRSA